MCYQSRRSEINASRAELYTQGTFGYPTLKPISSAVASSDETLDEGNSSRRFFSVIELLKVDGEGEG